LQLDYNELEDILLLSNQSSFISSAINPSIVVIGSVFLQDQHKLNHSSIF